MQHEQMSKQEQLGVLIVGGGMYACGTGTQGFGTILPAVLECYRAGLIGKIGICGRDPSKRAGVMEKALSLTRMMGLTAPVQYHPSDGAEAWPPYIVAAQS